MKVHSLCSAVLMSLLSLPALALDSDSSEDLVMRGRYLTQVAGCNDCHTQGYPQAAGQVPVEQWLTGTPVGFQGPWGTSYPTNLRLYVNDMSEEQWMTRVRQPMRPPMPWFALRDMHDQDVRAIYRFIKSLGPAGEAAPPAAGPNQHVKTPYIEFLPKNLPAQVTAH